jgi:hypothetical protein
LVRFGRITVTGCVIHSQPFNGGPPRREGADGGGDAVGGAMNTMLLRRL